MAVQNDLFAGANASHRMTDVDAVRKFILAGNSRFTIVSTKTGARFTFRVRRADDKPAFVSVLTGHDNETDYEILGTIFEEKKFVHNHRKSRISPSAPSAKAFAWFIERLLTDKHLPTTIEFWHEGRCGRCNRALTDPFSIESGFGPECAKHNLQHHFMVTR